MEGELTPDRPNNWALCSFPVPTVPTTVLPALWAQNLRAISDPSVVDLAWGNLLDTTAFLRGMKVIAWAWLLRSSGPAPCFYAHYPQQAPLAASAGEQNISGTGFLLTNAGLWHWVWKSLKRASI